jgi:hypothetical protein
MQGSDIVTNVATVQAVHQDLALLARLAPAFDGVEDLQFFETVFGWYDKLLCQPVNDLLHSLNPEVGVYVSCSCRWLFLLF